MHSPLATPTATRAVLERYGHSAKHRLGQNFLVSDMVIARIGELAELDPNDCVLEVGPGIGTLTCALLPEVAAVVAIEADPDLPPILAVTCEDFADKLALIQADALKVKPSQVTHTLASRQLPDSPTKLVSNLPYQVAATVVLRAFEQFASISRVVVMVQAEVADRMCAREGTKAYGAYTAKLRLYAQPTGRFEVGPHNFMPAPHVQSAVIRIDRKQELHPNTGAPLAPAVVQQVASLIDAAFSQRRKTLVNALGSSGFNKDQVRSALHTLGLPETIRAEALTCAQFILLHDQLNTSEQEG